MLGTSGLPGPSVLENGLVVSSQGLRGVLTMRSVVPTLSQAIQLYLQNVRIVATLVAHDKSFGRRNG